VRQIRRKPRQAGERLLETVEGRVQILDALPERGAVLTEHLRARSEGRPDAARRALGGEVFEPDRLRQFAGDRLDGGEVLAQLRDGLFGAGLVVAELPVLDLDRGGAIGQRARAEEEMGREGRGSADQDREHGDRADEIAGDVELAKTGVRVGEDEDRVELPRHPRTSLSRPTSAT